MTEQQFAYWLQGFAELNPNAPTQEQWQSIRDHLATVFKKVTPPVDGQKLNMARNQELSELLKKHRPHTWPAPTPAQPYSPYWLDGVTFKPGEIIC